MAKRKPEWIDKSDEQREQYALPLSDTRNLRLLNANPGRWSAWIDEMEYGHPRTVWESQHISTDDAETAKKLAVKQLTRSIQAKLEDMVGLLGALVNLGV